MGLCPRRWKQQAGRLGRELGLGAHRPTRGPHERRSSSSCPHEPKGRDGGDGARRRGRSNGGEVAGTWRWPDLVAPGPFRPDPTAVRRGRRRGSPGGGADHVEAQRGQGEKKIRERKGRGEGRGRPGGARCCSGEQLRRGRRRGLVRELPPLELGDEGAGGDAGAVPSPRWAQVGHCRARRAGGGGERWGEVATPHGGPGVAGDGQGRRGTPGLVRGAAAAAPSGGGRLDVHGIRGGGGDCGWLEVGDRFRLGLSKNGLGKVYIYREGARVRGVSEPSDRNRTVPVGGGS